MSQPVFFNQRQSTRIANVVRRVESQGPDATKPTWMVRNRQLLRITSDTRNSLGYYPSVWLLSNATDASHEEKSTVWAWPVAGEVAVGDYFEGETVGAIEDVPVFRGWSLGDDIPDILRVVTNNCFNDKPTVPTVFHLDADTVVDDGGQTLIDNTVAAGKGPVAFKASVTWSDPDWSAYTNDHFEFRLIIDGTLQPEVCEHIVLLGGPSATVTKEFTWHYTNPTKRPVPFLLYAIRTSGFGDLTATTDTKLEVSTVSATNRVEYRQLILPHGVKVGPKVCVDDPQDCCIDDQSSISSSAYLNLPCCPVPVPTQWKVTLSGVHLPLGGDIQLPGSSTKYNFDALAMKFQTALNATHVLTFTGTAQAKFSSTYIDCVFEKTLSIPSPYYQILDGGTRTNYTITDLSQPSNNIAPKIVFKVRHLVATNTLFYNYLTLPTGPVNAPEVAAMASLEIYCGYQLPVMTYMMGVSFDRQYRPHYTGDFHTTQDWIYPQEYGSLPASSFPAPGTACDGPCNLWSTQSYTTVDGQTVWPTYPFAYPLFVKVEPV